MDKYKFGEFIYQKRKKLGLTQEELGRKLGVTNKAVSKWEVGETTPDITMLEPLASALQVTVDELLKQETVIEKNDKITKVNKSFVVLTILLASLNVLTIVVFCIINIYNNLKIDKVILDNTNYTDIININPMTNFVCDGQAVMISSSYELDNKYYLNEEQNITFVILYEINYYYLDNEDNICLITYYSRTKEVVLTSDVLDEKEEIYFQPKNEITNFKSFKNVTVSYSLDKYFGEVCIVKK